MGAKEGRPRGAGHFNGTEFLASQGELFEVAEGLPADDFPPEGVNFHDWLDEGKGWKHGQRWKEREGDGKGWKGGDVSMVIWKR